MVVGVRFRDYLATVNKKRSNTIPVCVDTEVGNYYLGAGNNRNITANSIQAYVEVPLV